MTQDNQTPTPPPSILVSVLTRLGAHLFTAAAGVMVTEGVLSKDQGTELVSLGLAVLTWAAGYAWNEAVSYLHRKNANVRIEQAKAGS